jgi:hypothetical protein
MPRDPNELGFARSTFRPELREVRRDDDTAWNARRAARFERLHEVRRRHCEEGYVDRVSGFGHAPDRVDAEYRSACRVHGNDPAAVPMLRQELHDASAELCGVAGGADDGDAPGLDDPAKEPGD